MNKIDLNIELIDSKWEHIGGNLYEYSAEILQAVIDEIKTLDNFEFLQKEKPVTINLCLSNDEDIRSLNKEFRDMDNATNVLSFANIDDENFSRDMDIFEEIELGDIVISYETLQKEAGMKNIPFINHYSHLLIHGILHLFGFDHIEDDEADYMEDIETKVLKNLNIDNPYTE